MFTSRAFNIAFAISLTWHIIWMSIVNVIVLPGKYKARELPSVVFLGPILEKTALDIMLANKPIAVTTSYQHTLRYSRLSDHSEDLYLKDEGKKYIERQSESDMKRVFSRVFRKNKEIPSGSANFSRKKDKGLSAKSGSAISGSIASREIIFKPKKPELPSEVEANVPFMMELEFVVSRQGEVKEIIPIVSSGDPEVDLLGIRYLKGWRFAPLSHAEVAEDRGRIKVVFDTGEEDRHDKP